MGRIFDKLSKPGVQTGNNVSFFPDATARDAAVDTGRAASLQQSHNLIDNSFTVDATGRPTFNPITTPVPAVNPVNPSFQESALTPSAPSLTTKGKVLSTILNGMMGFAAGTGARTGGEGFQRGLQTNLGLQDQREEMRDRDINRQYRQAQIDNLPTQRALLESELRLRNAQEKANLALANKRELGIDDQIALKKKIALDEGLQPNTPEYNKFVLGIDPTDAGATNAFKVWHEQNPKAPISDWFALQGDNKPQPYADFVKGYPDTPQGRAQAAKDYAKLTRPNYAGQNQKDDDDRDQRRKGTATGLASRAMKKAGNDPLKAIGKLDEFVAGSDLSEQELADVAEAKRQLQEQHKASKVGAKSGNAMESILQGILQPGSATAN